MANLSTSEKNKLKKKTNYKSNLSTSQNLVDFFDLFFVCEVTARKLIKYYQTANNKPVMTKYESYTTPTLRSAIKYYSLSINDSILKNIFLSGEGKRNQKSCRQLRNAYIHSLLNEDKQEIINRFPQLKNDMDTWISLF